MTKKTSTNEQRQAIMTTEEVADFLRVPVKTVYEWSHKEIGPQSSKIGRHLRFRRSDVEAWFDEQAS